MIMNKLHSILLFSCLLSISLLSSLYCQSGRINYPNNVIKLCSNKASISVDLEVAYNISGTYTHAADNTLTSGMFKDDCSITLTFKVSNTLSFINLSGKQVPISSIYGFLENYVRIGSASADVYVGGSKINTINMGVEAFQDVEINGTLNSVTDTYTTWSKVLNTSNRDEILRLLKQGVELKNFILGKSFAPLIKYVATPNSACAQLNSIGVKEQYTSILNKADDLFNSQQYDEAIEKYKAASKLDYREQYPKDKIKEIKRIQGKLSSSDDENQNAYNSTETENITYTDENSYDNTTANSSSDYDTDYSANSNSSYQSEQKIVTNYYQQAQNIESNRQTMYQAADDLAGLVGNIFSDINEDRENERARDAELERQRLAEERRIREIEMAWNAMNEFENGFNGYYKKNFYEVVGRESLYFYFGTTKKYRNDKSGSMKLSNVFPVYSYPDGTWPFVSCHHFNFRHTHPGYSYH
jgi:hypothetical protein